MKSFTPTLLFLTVSLLVFAHPCLAIDLGHHPGKAIYEKLCLECHGTDGEGAEDVDVDPLIGSRDIASLAGRIERTMPEDKEHLCVGDDARLVAEYVYHAFYSEEAQLRKKPIYPDLNRLTGPQFENSVTDLIGLFLNTDYPPMMEKRGLHGRYTLDDRKKAGTNDYKRENFERDDPVIKFDYGTGLPQLPEGMKSKLTQFKIEWTGSVFAKETGIYEFTLRTRNGAKLFINEPNEKLTPTIDAWVAPTNEIREETSSIRLLGGRRYFVRLEFFKYKEEKSYIELLWKTPHGVKETIPAKALDPDWNSPEFVASSGLPADDRSYGYERGSSVSRFWLDGVHSIAFEAADHVNLYLDKLAKTKPDAGDRTEKIRAFAAEFAAAGHRRPLSDKERRKIVDSQFASAETPEDAVRQVVLSTLTSPQFLYPGTAFDNPHGPWAKASNLALSIWDSVPSRKLRDTARKGTIENPKFLERLTWDMLWDGRARHKMAGFFEHWLELSKATDIAKDSKLYPEYSEEMLSDLRKSLLLFVDDMVWSNAPADYRKLLLSDTLFLNERLGKVYGKPEIKGGFQKVSFPNQGRTGVITHPYLLTAFAYHNNTSPIHRGVFLTRNIVGLTLKPPPEAIEFKDNDFPPNLTMREKVTELTRAKACMACHSMINPLGFSLEHYDAIGRWRAKEGQNPINDDGILKTDGGDHIEIKGPRDVANYAANSHEAHRAFVRQLFHHTVKQPALAYGPDTPDQLEESFRQIDYDIRSLLVKIALTSTQPLVPES